MGGKVVHGINRTGRNQGQKSQVGYKVGYIDQGIVLAKLIEIQCGETLAFHDEMFGRKIAVCWAPCEWLELGKPTLNPVQNLAEGTADLSVCGDEIPLPNSENVEVVREDANTPTIQAARMQPVQPLGCPFHSSKSALSGKNNIAERRAVLPAQDQDLPGRVVSQRLDNRESPSGEAAAP